MTAMSRAVLRTSDTTPSILRRHPLLVGESANSYDALLKALMRSIEPADIVEQIWVKDIVDYAWEAQRLRIYKIHLCSLSRRAALVEALLHLGITAVKADELAEAISK